MNSVFATSAFWQPYLTLEPGEVSEDDFVAQVEGLRTDFTVRDETINYEYSGRRQTAVRRVVEFPFCCGERFSLVIEYEPKVQLMNPGEPVPIKVVADVREPAVYFVPKAAAPALTNPGQVQPAFLAEGWKQALDGQRIDLIFRLVQSVNPKLAREALEELHLVRDPLVLDQLFDWIAQPPPLGEVQTEVPAQHILLSIGDKNGGRL